MNAAIRIGSWVRRSTSQRTPWRQGRWHLVDSTIEDSVVTRCGRRMKEVVRDGRLEASLVKPTSRGQTCLGGCS